MTMDRAGTGRCAMRTDRLRTLALAVALGLAPVIVAPAYGEPVPEPPPEAQAAHQVTRADGLAARLLADQPSPVRSLDPAIFTELSPVTASEPPVRLPDDQTEDR